MKENNLTPRGIRNNNPLNIRRSKALFAGRRETVTDTSFEEFRKLLYGYLAALQLIGRYMTRHHLYTPSGIINRWAPPTENQTNKYLDFVCRETGIGGQENLSLYDKRLKALVKAMAVMENGRRWVDETHDAAIEQAWGMWVE